MPPGPELFVKSPLLSNDTFSEDAIPTYSSSPSFWIKNSAYHFPLDTAILENILWSLLPLVDICLRLPSAIEKPYPEALIILPK